jgi:hypothetical protein
MMILSVLLVPVSSLLMLRMKLPPLSLEFSVPINPYCSKGMLVSSGSSEGNRPDGQDYNNPSSCRNEDCKAPEDTSTGILQLCCSPENTTCESATYGCRKAQGAQITTCCTVPQAICNTSNSTCCGSSYVCGTAKVITSNEESTFFRKTRCLPFYDIGVDN